MAQAIRNETDELPADSYHQFGQNLRRQVMAMLSDPHPKVQAIGRRLLLCLDCNASRRMIGEPTECSSCELNDAAAPTIGSRLLTLPL